MKTVIAGTKEEGVPVKRMVGGAPISQSLAASARADAYAKNASEAVEKAGGLLGFEP